MCVCFIRSNEYVNMLYHLLFGTLSLHLQRPLERLDEIPPKGTGAIEHCTSCYLVMVQVQSQLNYCW